MHWVAHDTEFLHETLANTIKVDEFTRNLYNIHERILAENDSAQVYEVVCLCWLDKSILQIEISFMLGKNNKQTNQTIN